jgi:heme/copper-type cytochrome/quinol oxidase subunit 2
MFFPQTAQEGGQNTVIVLAFQITLLVIGIILTFVAYIRKI